MQNTIFKNSAVLVCLVLFIAGPLAAQCNLPLLWSFDSPPEFDPSTTEIIKNITGDYGVVEIVNGKGAAGTAYAVRMGKNNDAGGSTRNTLNLKMNLLGCAGKQLEFSFYFQDFNGKTQYYDGIFFSDQGGAAGTFKRVIALEPERWCDGLWGYFRVDFDELMAKYGLNYTANFVVQIQQESQVDFNWQNEEAFYIDEVTLREADQIVPAKVPLKDGFASGLADDPHWVFQTLKQKNNAQEVETYFTPYEWTGKVNSNASDGDGYSLFLGKWNDCGGFQRNMADLHLDLSRFENTDLMLWFDFYHNNDETQFYDGIWLSDDGGKTFPQKPLLSFEPATWANRTYGRFQPINLSEAIKKAGLRFSTDFVIRFQHEDDEDYSWQNEDGLWIDNIHIDVLPPIEYKKVPFCDNFDNPALKLDHYRLKTAELDANGKPLRGTTPSYNMTLGRIYGNGPNSWHFGKINDFNGENINYLDIHINAANLASTKLSFDLIEFIEEAQTDDGVWLSVDGGMKFEKIYDFPWAANPDMQWKAFQLQLDALAAAKGMVLSDKTVVRFQQNGQFDFSWQNEDGYVIKNICLSGTVPSQEPNANTLSFSLSPNPADEIFSAQVDLPKGGDCLLTLCDVTGRTVFQQRWTGLEAGTQQLLVQLVPTTAVPGIYIAHLQDSNGATASRRLVIR